MKGSLKSYNQIAGKNIGRLEALSDGVFAVALTLLVLDIRVPVSAAIKTEGQLVNTFCLLTPKLLTYFLSFMTLGIFWTGQTTQFSYLEKSDRNLTWICFVFLMLISLLPFTTAFLSEYIHFKFALGIYWLNILSLGLTLLINWNYAYRNKLTGLAAEDGVNINRAVKKRIYIAQGLYAAAASLCFINIYLSISVIILIQINYAVPIFNKRI